MSLRFVSKYLCCQRFSVLLRSGFVVAAKVAFVVTVVIPTAFSVVVVVGIVVDLLLMSCL